MNRNAEDGTEVIGSTLRVCPGGPLLVRGASSVSTPEGRELPVRRPVIALCRCGGSSRPPYCDGTHKLLSPAREAGGDADVDAGPWLLGRAQGQ